MQWNFSLTKGRAFLEKRNACTRLNLFIYHTTLAALTLIILFSENAEISK